MGFVNFPTFQCLAYMFEILIFGSATLDLLVSNKGFKSLSLSPSTLVPYTSYQRVVLHFWITNNWSFPIQSGCWTKKAHHTHKSCKSLCVTTRIQHLCASSRKEIMTKTNWNPLQWIPNQFLSCEIACIVGVQN